MSASRAGGPTELAVDGSSRTRGVTSSDGLRFSTSHRAAQARAAPGRPDAPGGVPPVGRGRWPCCWPRRRPPTSHTVDGEVTTPLGQAAARTLADVVGIVPILRAGLGMAEGLLDLIPEAEVWHIGLFRDEATLRPTEYYNKFPARPRVTLAFLVDPMLATGGSAVRACEILKSAGVPRLKLISLIAAPEGIARLEPGDARRRPSTSARSTSGSTKSDSSIPASATPATASSPRARRSRTRGKGRGTNDRSGLSRIPIPDLRSPIPRPITWPLS